jgi:hypothetical protein
MGRLLDTRQSPHRPLRQPARSPYHLQLWKQRRAACPPPLNSHGGGCCRRDLAGVPGIARRAMRERLESRVQPRGRLVDEQSPTRCGAGNRSSQHAQTAGRDRLAHWSSERRSVGASFNLNATKARHRRPAWRAVTAPSRSRPASRRGRRRQAAPSRRTMSASYSGGPASWSSDSLARPMNGRSCSQTAGSRVKSGARRQSSRAPASG